MSTRITNYIELKQRITELQAERVKQEELIKQSGREVLDALNPVNIIKESVSKLVHDREFHTDALSGAISFGTRFIIEKIFRTNKSVKRHIFADILENWSVRYINGHLPAIKEMVGKAVNAFAERIK